MTTGFQSAWIKIGGHTSGRTQPHGVLLAIDVSPFFNANESLARMGQLYVFETEISGISRRSGFDADPRSRVVSVHTSSSDY